MKKQLLTCIAASTFALTLNNAYAQNFFSLYGGFGLGPVADRWDLDSTIPSLPGFNRQLAMSSTGFHSSFDAGIQLNMMKIYYLNIEGFYDLNYVSSSQQYAQVNFKQKAENSFGARMIHGINVTSKNAINIIMGYVQTKFKRSGNQQGGIGNDFDKNVNGFQFGLGTEVYLTPKMSLSNTIIYSTYNKIRTNEVIPGTAINDDSDYVIGGDAYTLSLRYYFNRKKMKPFREFISPFAISDVYLGAGVSNDQGSTLYKDINQGDLYYMNVNGFGLNLFAGKKVIKGKMALAMEAHGSYTSDNFKVIANNSTNNEFTFKRTYNFGISIMPGLKLNDNNVMYIRTGAVYSQFSWKGNLPTNNGVAFTHWDPGLEAGVGDEIALTRQTTLRIQYVYTRYLKFNRGSGSNYQFTPGVHAFNLDFSYYL